MLRKSFHSSLFEFTSFNYFLIVHLKILIYLLIYILKNAYKIISDCISLQIFQILLDVCTL